MENSSLTKTNAVSLKLTVGIVTANIVNFSRHTHVCNHNMWTELSNVYPFSSIFLVYQFLEDKAIPTYGGHK